MEKSKDDKKKIWASKGFFFHDDFKISRCHCPLNGEVVASRCHISEELHFYMLIDTRTKLNFVRGRLLNKCEALILNQNEKSGMQMLLLKHDDDLFPVQMIPGTYIKAKVFAYGHRTIIVNL